MPALAQPGWDTPPFTPTIVEAPDGHARLVGRGAFNSKGPLVGTLAAIRAFRDAGVELPVNLRFMIEGEEEVGSPTLPIYLKENKDVLSRCDGALMPFMGTNIQGQHVLRLGFKGVNMIEFRVAGGDWGGPTRGEIHGYWQAVVANPGWELVGALATLVARDGSIAVDGFDALVPSPTADDHMLMDDVARKLSTQAWLKEVGVRRLQHDEPVRALVERLLFNCTLNIDGIEAGRLSDNEVPPTQIPRSARAFCHLRVVPGVDVGKALDLIREHLDRRGYAHIEMITHYSYKASKCSHREPLAQAMIEAYRRHGDDNLLLYPMHAGAAPLFLFSEILGIPWIFGGMGHGGGAHAPNEYFNVDDGLLFMKSMASFLFAFARKMKA
jgi:acetylornithine deacetylase/succinyl-diaminopimelate desuccinylase-like protein